MDSQNEKFTLDYEFRMHDSKPDTVVMEIRGTGMDLSSEKSRAFMKIMLDVIGAQMYAHVNGISPDAVKISTKLPHKNSN